jgi:hypothetical protein
LLPVSVSCQFVSSIGNSLFADDFEIGDVSNWSIGQIGSGASVSIASGRARSGLYSLNASVGGGEGNRTALARVHFSTTDPTYLLFYVFIDSSLSLPVGSQVELADLSDSVTSKSTRIYLTNVKGKVVLSADHIPAGTTAVSLGVWHALEYKYQSGTGDITVSLDDKEELRGSGLTLAAADTVRIGLSTTLSAVSASAYFDDVVVRSAPIGSSNAGVTVRHASSFGRTALTLDTTLWGLESGDSLVVTLGNSVVYTKKVVTPREFPVIQLASLKAGEHQMRVALFDSAGTTKAQVSETIRKYVDGTPAVAIDENNAILHNGKRIFPVTPFVVSAGQAKAWLKAGYINVNGWWSGWATAYTKEQFKEYIDAAGLSIGPDVRFLGDGSGLTINDPSAIDVAKDYFAYLKDDPNLFMWTWVDEPDRGGPRVLPSRIKDITDVGHSIDGNHPSLVNLYGYSPSITKARGFVYPNLVADVYSFDVYPVIYHGTIGTTMTSYVSTIDQFQRYNYGLTPWFSFIEVRANPKKDGSCCTPGPTPQQLRMEAWLNVVHGIKGIAWWHPQVTIPPENLAEMARFVDQTGRLTDAILGPRSTYKLTSNATQAGQRIDTMVREDATTVWVFAVRLTDFGEEAYPSLDAKFQISGIANATAQVFDENRTVAVANGTFNDSFPPCAVHIYRIPKPQGPTGIKAVVH